MKNLLLLILTLATLTVTSQTSLELAYHLPQNVTYNTSIPTPKSVIGHEVGEWHVTHDKLVQYMQRISAVSDRISIENRGKTFEGRPLLLLTITSSENHKNIENIQINHLKLTDAFTNSSLDITSMPLVVYQGFSIHGNEPSGSNASMLLAYYLAAAEGEDIDRLLKHTVILLDPSYNPDGLQRFASWVNMHKSENINPDPNDREYSEVWPKGRTNHYWFDLNRDWLPAQLPESRARIKTFNKWMPNILTDHHEMSPNATFFFQPGIQSRVHPLTPKMNQELTKEIGNYHAKALDKIGSLYFTEERFDDFYYGKGSTFPDINGAIGILFEQASSRGHAQETDNGLLTFPFTIKNQFTTALSTLEAAQNMRVKLLNYQKDFYINEKNNQTKSGTKAFVFGDEKDNAKAYHLAEILNRHQIEINTLNTDVTINGKQFKKETSYVVRTNQRKSTIINAIFEKRTTFTDSLFYDISAWTYPLAFNVDYEALKTTGNTGTVIKDLKPNKGLVSTKSDYAYLMEWHNYYTPKALNKLLEKDIRVKVGLTPFSLNNLNFDYGTILIPVQNQNIDSNALYALLNEIAEASNLNITGVNTGLTKGIDLGSSSFKTIKKPQVGLLIGDGITPYDAGEIWHLFDQRYKMPITKLDVNYLNSRKFSKYSTLIIPNSKLKLDTTLVNDLKTWVKNGGVLIGYEKSIKWLSSNNFIEVEYIEPKVETHGIRFEEKDDFKGAQYINGSIFEAEIDRSHPINFGYKNNKLAMFRKNEIFIKADSLSYNNPIKYTKEPLLSGYISEENLEAIKGTVPVQIKKMGKGKIIIFTDNTNFRGFWYGTNKLLMNAVFFANQM